jgi:hypothetical protein
MDLKTLQQAIATPQLADSAFAVHQGKNVKVYYLTQGGLFIQKLWNITHIKGSDNPFSVVVFIGCGPTATDLLKGDLPKARDLKPGQFYWFQGWDTVNDKPFIFKAGTDGSTLNVGVDGGKPVRVTYYAVNGAENLKVEVAPIEETQEVQIVTDNGNKRGTAVEERNDKHDKDTEFWRKFNDENSRRKNHTPAPLEILLPGLNAAQVEQIQTKYRNTSFKEYKGEQVIVIPYEVIYDTDVLRRLTDSFGKVWHTDVIARTVL